MKVDNEIGGLEVESGTFSGKIDKAYLAAGIEMVQRGDQWVVGTPDELAVAESRKYQ